MPSNTNERAELEARIAQAKVLREQANLKVRVDVDAAGNLIAKPIHREARETYRMQPKTSRNADRAGKLAVRRSSRKLGKRLDRDKDFGC